MGDKELPCLEAKLHELSDAELASLIIECAGLGEAALALGEETYRRLTQMRRWNLSSPISRTAAAIAN